MEMTIANSLNSTKLHISRSWLLVLYWLIPLAWLLVYLDTFHLSCKIKNSLPYNPESIFLFTLFFITPHTLASAFSFFDQEYIAVYKNRLLTSLSLTILLVALLPLIIGIDFVMTIYLIWTIVHVVGQQFGMSILMTKTKGHLFSFWKWTGLTISTFIYLDLTTGIGDRFLLTNFITYGSLIMFAPFTLATIMYSAKSKEKIGIIAVWLNYTLVLSSWLLYILKYPFFVFLVPRLIHDITAFMFYIAHDRNRNRLRVHNFLYKPFIILGIPVLFLCPILAMLFSYMLNQANNILLSQMIITGFGIFHYFTDSFVWKNGSAHRRELIIN